MFEWQRLRCFNPGVSQNPLQTKLHPFLTHSTLNGIVVATITYQNIIQTASDVALKPKVILFSAIEPLKHSKHQSSQTFTCMILENTALPLLCLMHTTGWQITNFFCIAPVTLGGWCISMFRFHIVPLLATSPNSSLAAVMLPGYVLASSKQGCNLLQTQRSTYLSLSATTPAIFSHQ